MKNIDAVITWVDGEDPAHIEKLSHYKKKLKSITNHNAGSTRFNSLGEIYYCIASIIRFAPFIKRIFIVTDNQDPKVDKFIEHNFPKSDVEIIIVDHREIYKGYEDVLPIFNSISIVSVLWRIPNISDDFIYFNDDVFLIRPITIDNFYKDGKIIVQGELKSYVTKRIFNKINDIIGLNNSKFTGTMIRASKLSGMKKKYLKIYHTPHQVRVSLLRDFYKKNPKTLHTNIAHRFRDDSQYSNQVLSYTLGLQSGDAILRKPEIHVYIMATNRKDNYLANKIEIMDTQEQYKWVCIQSLDETSPKDRRTIFNWLNKKLKINWDF